MTVLNHSTNVGVKYRWLWIRKAKKIVKFGENLCWYNWVVQWSGKAWTSPSLVITNI